MLQFFATQFGINDPREVVALMGAHTLGKVDQRNTLVKYFWTRGEHSYFNNQYYKSMVDDRDWAIQCPGDKASFWLIGEPDGSAGKVTWKAHGRGWMENGGPFTWRRNLDLCFDGKIGTSGVSRLMKSLNTTEAGVFAACYDPARQLVDGGPGWTCEDKCYTP